ncbi:MAG: DegV family protein [Lachnospiraceae bacterium]|nr:DegV family protein [Lachnospiraceae bacterium]MBQ8165944.1 DegV family protein [Lachnospiraceae bacterium]
MREYVLVSDSTCDLPIDVIKDLGIKILPFSYSINDEVFEYYLDERDGEISAFYDRLRAGDMPITAQVNIQAYADLYEGFIKEGKDILYLAFSSGLSGSYQTSRLAIDMVKEDYPDAKIISVDSLSASIGEGIFLYEAAMLKKEGMDIDALAKWIEDKRLDVRHWFMVEDLFHLSRGGRLSAVGAVVGSALKIKPILSVDEEGKLVVKAKTRGVGKALDFIMSKVKEDGDDLSKLRAIIGHADALDNAQKLKAMALEAGMKEENIMIAPIGPIIGTHVGAGMTAFAFVTKM